MEFIGWLLLSVWDRIAYITGLVTIIPLLPIYRVESVMNPRSNPYIWKSMGFTYHKSGKRYLYRETIEAIGNGVWLALFAYLVVSKSLNWIVA